MIKKVSLAAIGVAIILGAFIQTVFASGIPQTVLDASSSVVYIEVESVTTVTSGSGFIIENGSAGTFIATNYHVIEDNPTDVSVWIDEDRTISATVVAGSEQHDLAIIKLAYPLVGTALHFSTAAKQGDAIYAIGFPTAADYLSSTTAHSSNDATITEGIISSVRRMQVKEYGPEVKILQISAPINSGNSGGPLLNSAGEVVGITTFAVEDSQGIYGAIDCSGLIEILQTAGMETEHQRGTLWYLWLGFGILAAVGFIVLIFYLKRKKRKKPKYKFGVKNEITLDSYVEKIGYPLDTESIVTLIMPVALELKDRHNQAEVYLQLAPNHIVIDQNGSHIRKLASDGSFQQTRFAAPEQLQGKYSGIKSDIYSLCAVMKYLYTYSSDTSEMQFEKNNTKDLSKAPALEIEVKEKLFLEIIAKGMQEEPEMRYASMQELIFALSSFNLGAREAFLPKSAVATSDKPKRKKSLLIGFALLLCVIIYFTVNLVSAVINARNQSFTNAKQSINNMIVSSNLFPRLSTYVGAGFEMESQNYDNAITAFASLGEYGEAQELVTESQYRKAALLADNCEFDAALKTYKDIWGYKDVENCYDKTLYRQADYYLQEENDFWTAIKIFNELLKKEYPNAKDMILKSYYLWGCKLLEESYVDAYKKFELAEGYEDTRSILDDLQVVIYGEAIDKYRQGDYLTALGDFKTIAPYDCADDYIMLCDIHLYPSSVSEFTILNEVVPLIGFEDADQLLVSSWSVARFFLQGKWKSGSNFLKFSKKSDGSYESSYNIPWFNWGDTFNIENGYYILEEKDSTESRQMYKITVLSQDCISLYAYKNNRIYELYRQN